MKTALGVTAALALTAIAAGAQDTPRTERVATVHVDDVWVPPQGDFVELSVRALGPGRTPVASLSARDFVITEDTARIDADDVTVALLEDEKLGVACVLVLDTSPTMAEPLPAMKAAARDFLDRIGSYDHVAIVSFAGDVEELAGFSSSAAELRRAIDGITAETDPAPTRVYDAIHRGVEMLRREPDLPRRAIVIVFSDGSDGGSHRSLEEVVELAKGGPGETRILLYTIAYPTGFGDAGTSALRKIAEGTTADSLLVEPGIPLTEFYARVWKHVMKSYIVRLVTDLDGATHKIEVATGEGRDVRNARYPDRGSEVLGFVFGGLGVLCLGGGAVAFALLMRPGQLIFQGGPEPGRKVRLKRGVNGVGQHAESRILIKDDTVSRRHAEVEVKGRKARLRDLDSTNGSFVNDVRVEGVQELQPGDRVRIADVELAYRR